MKRKMTEKQAAMCNTIIHTASLAAAGIGAGLAQLPCADSAAIVPIQITMVVSLGKVFGVTLSEGAAMSALTTSASTMVGRGISQVLIGWVPGVGNVINATTAAVVTETAGWVIANEFVSQTQLYGGAAA